MDSELDNHCSSSEESEQWEGLKPGVVEAYWREGHLDEDSDSTCPSSPQGPLSCNFEELSTSDSNSYISISSVESDPECDNDSRGFSSNYSSGSPIDHKGYVENVIKPDYLKEVWE